MSTLFAEVGNRRGRARWALSPPAHHAWDEFGGRGGEKPHFSKLPIVIPPNFSASSLPRRLGQRPPPHGCRSQPCRRCPPPNLLPQYSVAGGATPPWAPRRGRRSPCIHSRLVRAVFVPIWERLYAVPTGLLEGWYPANIAQERLERASRGPTAGLGGRAVGSTLQLVSIDVIRWCENSGGETGTIKIGVRRHFLQAPTGDERG